MKILQVPPRFYPYIGGAENYVKNLSSALVRRGHTVSVLCAKEPSNYLTEFEGIRVEKIGYVGKLANTNISLRLPFKLLASDMNLIHTHLPTPWSADWSAIIAHIRQKPLILSYYNDIVGIGNLEILARLYNCSILHFLLHSASRILVLQPNYIKTSPYLCRYQKKIDMLPCGVDTNRFKPLEDREISKTLFFLGLLDEFHRYKGLDYLLFALKMIKATIPDVKLVVGGVGGLLEEYKKLAKTLGIHANVEFVGFIPDDMLCEYYNRCNLFVLPSLGYQEGFGMVLLEALACGKPVVTTSLVGIAREIQAKNLGRVIAPKSADTLAKVILELLKNEALCEKMGKNGRAMVEAQYTWDAIAARLETIYMSVCSS